MPLHCRLMQSLVSSHQLKILRNTILKEESMYGLLFFIAPGERPRGRLPVEELKVGQMQALRIPFG